MPTPSSDRWKHIDDVPQSTTPPTPTRSQASSDRWQTTSDSHIADPLPDSPLFPSTNRQAEQLPPPRRTSERDQNPPVPGRPQLASAQTSNYVESDSSVFPGGPVAAPDTSWTHHSAAPPNNPVLLSGRGIHTTALGVLTVLLVIGYALEWFSYQVMGFTVISMNGFGFINGPNANNVAPVPMMMSLLTLALLIAAAVLHCIRRPKPATIITIITGVLMLLGVGFGLVAGNSTFLASAIEDENGISSASYGPGLILTFIFSLVVIAHGIIVLIVHRRAHPQLPRNHHLTPVPWPHGSEGAPGPQRTGQFW